MRFVTTSGGTRPAWSAAAPGVASPGRPPTDGEDQQRCPRQPLSTSHATADRAFRRADRRRRHLRRGRRLPPDEAVPGHQLRRARDRRRASAAPGGRTATPASAPTATCTPSAIASSPGPARRSPPRRRSCTYMGEVIEENDLGRHIRYHHRIVRRSWSSADNLWTIEATRTDTGETVRFTANFLWMCQGYYRHSEGYTPDWPGMDRLQGPHRAPADLARGPRLQGQAGRRDRLGRHGGDAHPGHRRRLRACHHAAALADLFPHRPQRHRARRGAARSCSVDETWIHEIVRRKILSIRPTSRERCVRRAGAGARRSCSASVRSLLGPDYDVDTHFTPSYRPWRQRIAFVPDGDLFQGIADGKASVVTDEIERFTETGILLKSGKQLDADIIVTATGFNLSVLGDIDFAIDGKPLDFPDTVTYRGMMFTGVPNMVWVFGYFRASWTLRADLVGDFVCRLLNAHGAKGAKRVEVGAAARGQGHAAAALDRPGELQSRLPDARHAPAAQARRQAGMAAQPGLLGARRTHFPPSTWTMRPSSTGKGGPAPYLALRRRPPYSPPNRWRRVPCLKARSTRNSCKRPGCRWPASGCSTSPSPAPARPACATWPIGAPTSSGSSRRPAPMASAAPRDGFDSVNLHRNKRGIALDLKHPDGHAAFLKLAATADVVVENMRMQVKHRLRSPMTT